MRVFGRTGLIVTAVAVALGVSTAASAAGQQPGVPDLAFGSRGVAALPVNHHGVVGPSSPSASVLTVSSSGIWVGGVQQQAGIDQDYTTRLTRSGRVDATFRDGQPYWETKSSEIGGTTAIVAEPDGGAVIATASGTCCTDIEWTFTRLSRTGATERGWGTNGRTTFDSRKALHTDSFVSLTAGVRLSDGRIRTAGELDGAGVSPALLGLTANGGIDTSVGPAGLKTFALPAARVVAMAADAQDRLYLLTAAGPSTHASLRVLRTTADGALDPTFGKGGGFTVTPPLTAERIAVTGRSSFVMKVSPSGHVYVGFTAWGSVSHRYRAVVTHASAAGQLVTAFGREGYAAFRSSAGGGQGWPTALTADGKGHLLLGLTYNNAKAYSQLVMRLDAPTGAIDPSFGHKGAAASSVHIDAIALVSAQRFVVLGATSSTKTGYGSGPSKLLAFTD